MIRLLLAFASLSTLCAQERGTAELPKAGPAAEAAPAPTPAPTGLTGAELDFPEGAGVEAVGRSGAPMLDPREAERFRLHDRGKFAHRDDAKRGFRKVGFSPNEVQMAAPSGARARYLPTGQYYQVGDTYTRPDGSVIRMTGFDGSKPLGSRHRWEVTKADGTKTVEYSSPLVFDLDGDGVRMSRRAARYDADGDLKLDTVNDLSSGDGVLVFDSDGDGAPGEGALETFGDAADLDGDHKRDGYADGFDALRALVLKAVDEKVLDGAVLDSGLDAAALRRLEERYGLRMRVGGVLKPPVTLEKAGVRALRLAKGGTHEVSDFDGQGNRTRRRDGAVFTRADGSTGVYEDVWFEH